MFEWDDAKNAANFQKHGVDFTRAIQIFRGDYLEGQNPRAEAEAEAEVRHLAVGEARGESYIVVFTWRGQNRRIISAWRVGEKGKRRYQELLLGRH